MEMYCCLESPNVESRHEGVVGHFQRELVQQQFSFWILLRRLWALAAVSRTEQKENERTVITFDPFEPPLCLLQSPVCGSNWH